MASAAHCLMRGHWNGQFTTIYRCVRSKPAGRKPRYKPVLNPEALLLPPVRSISAGTKVQNH